jgi:hypothetical protein
MKLIPAKAAATPLFSRILFAFFSVTFFPSTFFSSAGIVAALRDLRFSTKPVRLCGWQFTPTLRPMPSIP